MTINVELEKNRVLKTNGESFDELIRNAVVVRYFDSCAVLTIKLTKCNFGTKILVLETIAEKMKGCQQYENVNRK